MQLFGIKPCEPFLTMTTDEFAERFGETLKSSTESIEVYKKNVSVMVRKIIMVDRMFHILKLL